MRVEKAYASAVVYRTDKNERSTEKKERREEEKNFELFIRASFCSRAYGICAREWDALGVGKWSHWMPIENKIVNTWKFYNEHMCSRI